MNRYNNENIVLNEIATRSFLLDLFGPNLDEKNNSDVDLVGFSREETENGITYHFPDLDIDLNAEEKTIEKSIIQQLDHIELSYLSKINDVHYTYEELAEAVYNSVSNEKEYVSIDKNEKESIVLRSSNTFLSYNYAA